MSRRIRTGLAALGLAFAALALSAAIGWNGHQEIDIHSGRVRAVSQIGPWTYSIVEADTDLSRLALSAGLETKQPEWKRYHTRGGTARINYRFGGVAPNALRLPEYMDTYGLLAEDRQRLTVAVIHCLEQERRFTMRIDGGELSILDDHGVTLDSAPTHP